VKERAAISRLRKRVGMLLPPYIKAWINDLRDTRRTKASPDRAILLRSVLPGFAALRGRILWVGCRRYTADYPTLLAANGAEIWTMDIDETTARWGAPGRHLIFNLASVDDLLAPHSFDALLCNGVFGFGLDEPAAQRRALRAMAHILKPGGWLLLGWNTDRCMDPLAEPLLQEYFVPQSFGELDSRCRVAGTTHVYDFLRRRDT
jgi:SAM-dependent methyltransferase